MNSKEMLRDRVVTLNVALGRPTNYWQDSANEPNKVSIGHFSLEYNREYDHPYQLVETTSESGGERSWGQRMSASEMAMFIDGIFQGITMHVIKGNTKDGCETCQGARGGVPGNENIIDGKKVCDYCHADMMRNKQNG